MTSRYISSNAIGPMVTTVLTPAGRLRLREDLFCGVETADETVDLLGERVQIDAGPRRCRYPEALHERLRAVVTGADGNALVSKDLRDIVRVHASEFEGDDPAAALERRAEDRQALDLAQAA